MAMLQCPKCGSREIDTGYLMSAGKVGYRSRVQKNPFVTCDTPCELCLACGYLEIYIDALSRQEIREKRSQR